MPSLSGKSGTTISIFEITPQFVEKLRYIHRNPVKQGLCERPEDGDWSSFRHYATGAEGRVEIESGWTARKREPAAGKHLPPDKTAPPNPKPRWNGHPAPPKQ